MPFDVPEGSLNFEKWQILLQAPNAPSAGPLKGTGNTGG